MATALIETLRDKAGIEKLTRHDLSRSFGAMMTGLDARKRFFNHAHASQVSRKLTPRIRAAALVVPRR